METILVDARPMYEAPAIVLMDRDDVLRAFQMTAAQISAAGCWWGSTCTKSSCSGPCDASAGAPPKGPTAPASCASRE